MNPSGSYVAFAFAPIQTNLCSSARSEISLAEMVTLTIRVNEWIGLSTQTLHRRHQLPLYWKLQKILTLAGVPEFQSNISLKQIPRLIFCWFVQDSMELQPLLCSRCYARLLLTFYFSRVSRTAWSSSTSSPRRWLWRRSPSSRVTSTTSWSGRKRALSTRRPGTEGRQINWVPVTRSTWQIFYYGASAFLLTTMLKGKHSSRMRTALSSLYGRKEHWNRHPDRRWYHT